MPWNPTAKDVYLAIAGLGRHIKNNGPPGWLVLQRGMEKLLTMERGWIAMRSFFPKLQSIPSDSWSIVRHAVARAFFHAAIGVNGRNTTLFSRLRSRPSESSVQTRVPSNLNWFIHPDFARILPATMSIKMASGLKMALRRFALEAAGGFRGRSGDSDFARAMLEAFGAPQAEGFEAARRAHEFSIVEDGKKSKRKLAIYWPERRVALDVVPRDTPLDSARKALIHACLQLDSVPQYVVLTNQRDLQLFDLSRDKSEPRLAIAVDELPKYCEAFPFFTADWQPGVAPRIINVDKVSKEVADMVGRVYRALLRENPGDDKAVTQFTLQCIVAMFAEDIGMLPKEYFTTLLYQGAEHKDATKRLAKLFTVMSTKESERPGNEKGESSEIPYFNGGLFSEPTKLELGDEPLRAITKAAESNWRYVDPHIFGSVFQGIMDDAERHASGAHYTAREDIMSVVGPTIIEPWREKVEAAKTLAELKELLKELGKYRVLDPACGSGNFLYVAFRELYRLETEILVRMHEFASVEKSGGASWATVIKATNFFGIDINHFAVELAKTTLNIAKKIAFEERKETLTELYGQARMEVDPSLPMDNLDDNILCADALFTDWPPADAIIGNPPFLGLHKIREELGQEYVARVKQKFGHRVVDLCVYWFRRAHAHIGANGRAGLVATSAIRVGTAREASLEFILSSGGNISHAVSSKPWPGDAVLNVSIVNWTRMDVSEATLVVDGKQYVVGRIPAHLQLSLDLSSAKNLRGNKSGTNRGTMFGSEGFRVERNAVDALGRENSVRPTASGGDILRGRAARDPEYVVWLLGVEEEEAVKVRYPLAFSLVREHVYPLVAERAANPKATSHYRGWIKRWWEPRDPSLTFFSTVKAKGGLDRIVVSASPQSRPIFVFLSYEFIPTNTLQLFAFDDDYSFGIIQSSLHWAWTKAKGGRMKSDIRYTSKVWKTFPWPQEASEEHLVAVAQAGRELRATRDRLMEENGWSLRELYQAAEVEGPHPLKDAQAALDAAVEDAYGKPAGQEPTEFLLELNLVLAEDEKAGESIIGPGLPAGFEPKDPRWFSTDCIEPPPLPGTEDE